ncbi:MAG: DUF4364 family protein [Defluviitaleaceae bacterium]|nr:DUF4364 family protein [Defluviitaleaceae bacterium]
MQFSEKLQNNILILYILDKMNIPLTIAQIEPVALKFMDYFALSQSIKDLLDIRYIEKQTENQNIRYSISEEGGVSLEYLEKMLPLETRQAINEYILEHRKSIKRDYEITASYFPNLDSGDYTVKCSVYEDEIMLLEINLSVVTKDEANNIVGNWKKNSIELYGDIINKLLT